eukprot:3941391-Rhodomonas_salina.1
MCSTALGMVLRGWYGVCSTMCSMVLRACYEWGELRESMAGAGECCGTAQATDKRLTSTW